LMRSFMMAHRLANPTHETIKISQHHECCEQHTATGGMK
jgi:hypothetical protein